MAAPRRLTGRHPVLVFFGLALLFSWAIWSPIVAFVRGWSGGAPSPLLESLHLLGGLGPLLAAVVTLLLRDGRAAVRSWFGERLRIRGRTGWILLGLAAPFVLLWVAGLVAGVGWQGPGLLDWWHVGNRWEYLRHRLGYVAAEMLFFGLGEESGWRGFALPELQRRHAALTSALVVGLLWAAWHLPLFSFAQGLSGLSGLARAGWFFSILGGAVLLAWLFNASGGSTLAVAGFHGSLDVAMASRADQRVMTLVGAALTLWAVLAAVLLVRWDRRRRASPPRAASV